MKFGPLTKERLDTLVIILKTNKAEYSSYEEADSFYVELIKCELELFEDLSKVGFTPYEE